MELYIVLGLDRGATLGDVKRAYRRLARQYPPDINPGDRTSAAVFRRVNEAYEILSDPERRQRYDARGETPSASPVSSFQFEGFDFLTPTEGPAASTFGDLFADVFQASDEEDAGPAENRYVFITAEFDGAALPEPPASEADAHAAWERRAEEGRAKAERLATRFAGWYYVISSDSYERIHRPRDSFLTPSS